MATDLSLTEFVELTEKDGPLFERLDNSTLEKLTGVGKIKRKTGVDSRLILSRGTTPQQMGETLARKLFAALGDISGDDCGGLVVCHTAMDEDGPQRLADQIAATVGIRRGEVVGFPYGCTGFVKALELANEKAADMGEGLHMPILCVEAPDLFIDAKDPKAGPLFASRAAATSLFRGDGHTLLFAETNDVNGSDLKEPPGDDGFLFRMVTKEAVDFHGDTHSGRIVVEMNGDAAFMNGLDLMDACLRKSLEQAGTMYTDGDMPLVAVPHQPNGKMTKMLQQYCGDELGVRIVDGIGSMGNTWSATIPSTVARIEELDIEELANRALVLIPAAGICMLDPKQKMSVGRGAFLWKPGAYRPVDS